MKSRFVLLLFLVFSANNLVWSQLSNFTWPTYVTAGNWEAFPEMMRIGYLVGLLHGEVLGMTGYNKTLKESMLFDKDKLQLVWEKTALNCMLITCAGVGLEKMIVGVDSLYEDYANRDIAVYKLLPLVCKRVKGEMSQESIEKELQRLRAESR